MWILNYVNAPFDHWQKGTEHGVWVLTNVVVYSMNRTIKCWKRGASFFWNFREFPLQQECTSFTLTPPKESLKLVLSRSFDHQKQDFSRNAFRFSFFDISRKRVISNI